jgi:uncharacterized protein YukE
MTRIRVNTDVLKTKAKDFETAADAFNRAGDDIAAAAAAMPSYDGQLSGPARLAGYEIQRQARDMKAALSSDAQSLQKAAQDFENVENQAENVFNQNQEILLAADASLDLPAKGGDSYLGYQYLGGEPPIYILCMYGVCKKVIVTDENMPYIQYFICQVDGGSCKDPDTGITTKYPGYFETKRVYDALSVAAIAGDGLIILAGVLFICTGIGAPAGIGMVATGLTANASAAYFGEGDLAKMATATDNAAAAWNEIFPGDNQVGDPQYGIGDQGPGAGNPIYEPNDGYYTPPPTDPGNMPTSGTPDYGGMNSEPPPDVPYTPPDNSTPDNGTPDYGGMDSESPDVTYESPDVPYTPPDNTTPDSGDPPPEKSYR